MEIEALKRGLRRGPIAAFLLFIVLLLPTLFPAVAAAAQVGIIEEASGAVYFKARWTRKWTVATPGSGVKVGDAVKTGPDGRARLRLSDGTTLMVGNESELVIKKFLLRKRRRKAVYALSTGKMRAVVSKFAGSTDIKVRTPTGVAGVKGTDFIVMNHGSANVLFGKEDVVSVEGDDGGAVALSGGEMTENTRGKPPIEPVGVEPGGELEAARKQLEAATDVHAPIEWSEAGNLPAMLARWNINYGHYLADSRRYTEALEVFQIAIDLTEKTAARAEAYLARGTIYSRNLDDKREAIKQYMLVVEQYPASPFAENALYSAGMIEMDRKRKRRAIRLFKRYVREYPQGSHRETVENLLRVLGNR